MPAAPCDHGISRFGNNLVTGDGTAPAISSSVLRHLRILPRHLGLIATAVLSGAAIVSALLQPAGGSGPKAWATSSASGGTLRVAMSTPAYQGFDPATSYTAPQFEVLRLLQRTMLTFKGVPGYQGFRPVPDLAAAPPTVSADGLTWTFTLKPGIHYAPPLQDLEVTAADFVRAFERIPDGYGPGMQTLPSLLDGFEAFAADKSSSISGVVAVDDHTLQLRTTRPDRSLAKIMALPYTAPIPPSPRPGAQVGIATGHPFEFNDAAPWMGPTKMGFGPFQSATGPYMIEGADQIDHAAAPPDQSPPAGLTPSWWFLDDGSGHLTSPGRLVLVRNPSWDASTDPNRPAYPDRIEITIQPRADPYRLLTSGAVDTVIGDSPSPRDLAEVSDEARSRIVRSEANGIDWITLNLLQPPFDDVHVRRALALALDRSGLRAALVRARDTSEVGPVTDHVVPNSLTDDLLAGWSRPAGPSTTEARQEMRQSRYWSRDGCVGAACRPVPVGGFGVTDLRVAALLQQAMRAIGLRAELSEWETARTDCSNPANGYAACLFGWLTDYPDTGAMFPVFLADPNTGASASGTGMSAGDMRQLGIKPLSAPGIEADYARCSAALPAQATPCWARLDQWLTDKLVVVIPLATLQSVRTYGSRVSAFSVDQAFNEVALDRVAVAAAQ